MSQGFCSPVINTVRVSVGVSVDAGGGEGGGGAGGGDRRRGQVQATLPERVHQPKNFRRRMRRARWSPHPGGKREKDSSAIHDQLTFKGDSTIAVPSHRRSDRV